MAGAGVAAVPSVALGSFLGAFRFFGERMGDVTAADVPAAEAAVVLVAVFSALADAGALEGVEAEAVVSAAAAAAAAAIEAFVGFFFFFFFFSRISSCGTP